MEEKNLLSVIDSRNITTDNRGVREHVRDHTGERAGGTYFAEEPQYIEEPQFMGRSQYIEEPQFMGRSQYIEEPQFMGRSQYIEEPQCVEETQYIKESQPALDAESLLDSPSSHRHSLDGSLLTILSGVKSKDYNQEQEVIHEELKSTSVFDKSRILFSKKTALITIGILLVLLGIGGGLLGIQSFNILKFQAAHNALYREKIKNNSSSHKWNSSAEDTTVNHANNTLDSNQEQKRDNQDFSAQSSQTQLTAHSHNQTDSQVGKQTGSRASVSREQSLEASKNADIARNSASLNRVNINTATVQELESVKGIGPVTAHRIVHYRTKYGKFRSINDLKKISGIGNAKFQKIVHLITI